MPRLSGGAKEGSIANELAHSAPRPSAPYERIQLTGGTYATSRSDSPCSRRTRGEARSAKSSLQAIRNRRAGPRIDVSVHVPGADKPSSRGQCISSQGRKRDGARTSF